MASLGMEGVLCQFHLNGGETLSVQLTQLDTKQKDLWEFGGKVIRHPEYIGVKGHISPITNVGWLRVLSHPAHPASSSA